ncbi:MAG: L-serine ammonia-lyase, iron-sulfur-dependent, subunit alpha [Spirochaetaceae bacterium]|jgi:L-serine dehydratase|nr:L-serine ammonia-lyase, iron-sulfur-dependent, subunit alpha [Spirochaetaceae bacterium]
MKYRFLTYTELAAILEEEGLSPEAYAVKREAFIAGISEDAVYAELDRRIAVTRRALIKGLESPQFSRSGLTRGAAAVFAASPRRLIRDDLYRRAVTYALSINEVNACGGKVVSFPTAGSSGIVPGVIWAWWDSRVKDAELEPGIGETAADKKPLPPFFPPPYDERLRGAFLIAGLAGVLIAQGATLAGAEGGCQAECGAAGAMAACALARLEGLTPEDCFSAAALSLKNSLGLACDPVAGLVEVPCVKRNGFLAVNALTAVDLTLSGITSIIPFDEVVWAMKQIGDVMPPSVKETSRGGLALTPTGLSYRTAPDGLSI